MHGINRMRSKTRIRGFTLIEVMIVVAVIGILAAIALPAYQDYTVRSKVSEGIGFASAAKVEVVSAYSHGGLPESDAVAVGIGSQYVESFRIETGGNIRVTFNDTVPQLAGKSVMLAATERGGAIDWCCYSENIEARYMPASCRDSARCGSDPENGDSDDDDSKDDSDDGSKDDDDDNDGNEGDGNDSDDDTDDTTKCPEPLTPTGKSGKCKLPQGVEKCPDGWRKNGRNCTEQ